MVNKKIINTNNLLFNLAEIKKRHKNICAVVKANAYGHNAETIVNALCGKVQFFAVANANEGAILRQKFAFIKILILGKTTNLRLAIKNNLQITTSSLCEIKQIECLAKQLGTVACVHIKVNTGMNRLGTKSLCHFAKMCNYIKKSNHLALAGVYTHFFAPENKSIFCQQLAVFKKFVNKIPKNLSPTIHIGGSGVLNYTLPGWVNVVRVGLWLYGYGKKFLKPVMKIFSHIAEVKTVFAGEYVGYSCAFKAKKLTRVAVVAIGYADGLLRKLSNKGWVYVKNKKCKILGNVCMDMLMCDVTNLGSLPQNAPVVAFKNAADVAKITGESEYEILTNFNNLR